MKNQILWILTAGLLVANPAFAETLTIDPKKSKVAFKIMNKPPGADAYEEVPGSFKEFSGTVVVDEKDASKDSVEMKVKTASIDTANKKRDDHLRNQDFFKVKEFPLMTFKSRSVKKVADGRYEVTGDFTLLGKSKPIVVSFEKTGDKKARGVFKIKRSDFGMNYRVPDTADEVAVTLEIVGVSK